jgi:ubiquinone/menaquinone biosynthesis C-methylase UbiE
METTQTIWALGDYRRFAKDMVWSFGPALVQACGIGPGQRVLDVAAGTGNVAIRAALAGADVVASDLEPAQLEAGGREAEACGAELEWTQADAQALPFGDGEFDVVTSSAGVMFAPDHQAAANELLRVCRPGGTIGLITFTPAGMAGEFFALVEPYAPPPEQRPIEWGSEAHVRELLGDGVSDLRMTTHTYVEARPGGPRAFLDYYKATFGPMVALYAALDDDRRAELDHAALDFLRRWDRGPAGRAELPVEYLLTVATRTPRTAARDAPRVPTR